MSYEIEQLYIEGHSPKAIARILDCELEEVLAWIEAVNCDPEEESYDPFETVNS